MKSQGEIAMKKTLALLGTLLLAFLIASCGAAPGEGGAPAAEEEEAPAAEEEEAPAAEEEEAPAAEEGENILVIAAPATPKTVDFNFMSDPLEFEAAWNLYDKPMGWPIVKGEGDIGEGDLESVEGELVESWEVSDDALTYTFYLREGVKSYFGNELTAEDVKWWWEAAFAGEGVGAFIANINNVSSADNVTIIDDYTVEIQLDSPSSIFLQSMTIHAAGLYDATEVQKHATDDDPYAFEWLQTNDAGFGPYHVEELRPGEEIIYVANPNYWQGAPYFDRVVMKVVPDSAQRLQLLLAGDVDMALLLSPRQLEEVRQNEDKGVTVVSWPGIRGMSLRLNPNIEPFDNPELREAIAYATPYDDIRESVYFGEGRPMESYVPDLFPGYEPGGWTVETDLARAEELLTEAGYPDGLDVTLNYSSAVPEEEDIATLVKSSLEQIGIGVELNKLPAAQYTEGLFDNRLGFFMDIDMPLVPDAGYASWLWFHPGSPINYLGYDNPDVTSMIEEGLATPDLAEREAMYSDIQKTIGNEFVWLYLAFPGEHLAAKSDLKGFNWVPLSVTKWSDLSR
jgi:peptide/nickel transport system substrate-binding protein